MKFPFNNTANTINAEMQIVVFVQLGLGTMLELLSNTLDVLLMFPCSRNAAGIIKFPYSLVCSFGHALIV